MRNEPVSQSGFFILRALFAFTLCVVGATLGVYSFAAPSPAGKTSPPGMERRPAFERPTTVDSGTPSDWSIVNSPNSRPTLTDNFQLGVTCVSESDCWAVGYYDNGAYQTLIQHWDGTAWNVVNSPNTSPTQNNLLKGVTCTSSSDCWAVGSYDNGGTQQTLIEHWDGIAWTIVSSPNTSATQYNILGGVTCTSASDCWAVGSYDNGGTYQTLTEHWNGTAWTIVSSANSSASQNNFLNAVTCTSPSNCWAVGSYNSNFAEQTLIERWDGSAWTVVTSANTLLTQNNILLGVTCASASDCWAVGYYSGALADQTLVERWNGTSWTVVTSPNSLITQTNRLLNVTCASASECWTVGYSNNGSVDQTLIERWNGSAWSIATSPNADAAQNNTLASVTCASASECWSVGFSHNGSVQQTLIGRWNGTAWTIATSSNANAAQNNTLLGLTCASASDCWAVASYYNGSVQQTLIEHWDGTEWSIVPSPNTSATQSNLLYDVTCVSESDCWAVGYYLGDSGYQTLIEHWDGAEWSIVASPSTDAAQNNFLNDVTCTSASDCWAVGFYDNGSVYQTLIERWDGNAWTIINSPNTSVVQENRLFSMTCPAASDCWAVGRYFDGLVLRTLIEHWNGTLWTIVPSPNTSPSQDNNLSGVTCASASDCWAVGSYSNGSGTGQTLIERWDGTSWAIVDSPNPTAAQYNYNFLRNVTCPSGSECWAVGYYFNDGAYRTLIERWDGTEWSIVASPNTSATQNNYLFGVTCVSASECWATGYHYDESGVIQTLTQHYMASVPMPVTAISRKIHGTAGSFDIDLPLVGNPGIECRNAPTPDANKHQIVFSFGTSVAVADATVTPGTSPGATAERDGSGPPEISADGKEVTVNLKNVSDAQTLMISLLGVSGPGVSTTVSVPMSVLLGDVNAAVGVTGSDVNICKSQVGVELSEANFRNDVNLTGFVSGADVNLVKTRVGTTLP